MRFRSAALLSTVAIATLALAGCSSVPGTEPEPTDESGLCAAALPEGDATASLDIEGDVGDVPELQTEGPVEITEPVRTVVSEGDGARLQEGDMVEVAMAIYDAVTGELVQVGGFDEPMVPQEVSPSTGWGQLLGCVPSGSRIAAAVPGGGGAQAAVYVIDVLGVADIPDRAWGEDRPAVEGQPVVELAENGAPTITLPDTDPPTETVVTTLKEGDGAVVEAGDDVLAMYTGVQWSDGSVFDSSWEAGVPVPFNIDGVVTGFGKALEGQKVGSQVLVSMPPEEGYHMEGFENHQLYDESLTFVVDILASGKPMTQP
ncbi:FKBP-type peptidyl-prolyl cis-trans isomerase [Microbacterium album]|uniref:Peptidyl-prolyl cis-trans isomerase n=1 Tax=Microbacterium album TaxID=2053191 RepID=A0A917MM54_9MICO|nr:FKBP-type peptidyl-prolyl cis-trans isomerase [Microbacterium album]GGH46740.1 peptidylprolyl isomerase [Microbacterium album]